MRVASTGCRGAFLGAFIGALSAPARLGVRLASGLVAGAVIEVILNGIGWTINSDFEQALASGIRKEAIVALPVASLLALVLRNRLPNRTPSRGSADRARPR